MADEKQAEIIAIIDGSSRPNPGPAAYGVVFKDSAGRVLARISEPIGNATNIMAEWRALLVALNYARSQGWRRLTVLTDSRTVLDRLAGIYSSSLSPYASLCEEARRLIIEFDACKVTYAPRRLTEEAGSLALAILNRRSPRTGALR